MEHPVETFSIKIVHITCGVLRSNFQREASIMAYLNDVNITRLLGVCFSDDPICLVLEYHKFGDLKRFLRRHVVDGAMTQRTSSDVLR